MVGMKGALHLIKRHKLTEIATYHGDVVVILVDTLRNLLHFNEEIVHPNVFNLRGRLVNNWHFISTTRGNNL